MKDYFYEPEARYRVDPRYKAYVDAMEMMISRAELTPNELREASVLAAIHYEMRRAPVLFFVAGAPYEQHRDPRQPPEVVTIGGRTYRIDPEPREPK